MLYLYGVIDRAITAGPPGIGGTAVATVPWAGLRVMVEQFSRHRPPPPTPEALWRHQAVVEAAMREATILPFRFGTLLADARAMATALEAHRRSFEAALSLVRGRVEAGVTVAWSPPDDDGRSDADATTRGIDGAGAGAAYLRRLRAAQLAESAALGACAAVRAAVAHLVSAEVPPRRLPRVAAVSMALLLPPARLDRLGQRIRAVAADFPEMRLQCSAPWPPYSFAPRPAASPP